MGYFGYKYTIKYDYIMVLKIFKLEKKDNKLWFIDKKPIFIL